MNITTTFEQTLLNKKLITNDGLSLNNIRLLSIVDNPRTKWDSLLINRRKPHTVRVFTYIDDVRICLHKFYPCNSDESFHHPHPWPAKFFIVDGGYNMELGLSKDRFTEPEFYENITLKTGSSYSIVNPLTWHAISPIKESNKDKPTYTIMLNGLPFSKDTVHTQVRTTSGKDLEKLSKDEINEITKTFIEYLYETS